MDVFFMWLVFEKSKLNISHFLKSESVIDLENDWIWNDIQYDKFLIIDCW